jgi:hypothetical protein
LLYSAKLSFIIEGEIKKTFNDKQKLKQHVTSKPGLQKIPKGILHKEDESKHVHKRMEIIKSQEMSRKAIIE